MPSDIAEPPYKNSIRHVPQFLIPHRDLGRHYTVVDAGIQATTDIPVFIFSETGRTDLGTHPAYTEYTTDSDRANVRLEPDIDYKSVS